MAMVSDSRRPHYAPARKPLVASLCIAISHQAYVVERIAPGEDNVRAFRLVKKSGDGAVYDIAQGRDGINRCDCPDYETRHVGPLGMCKHLTAAVATGLIEGPTWTAPATCCPSEEVAPCLACSESPKEEPAPGPTDAEVREILEGLPAEEAPAADPLVEEALRELAEEEEAPAPAPPAEEATGTVEAWGWMNRILGRFGPVATDEQLRAAERIAGDPDAYVGTMIAPVGPDLAELERRLAEGRPAPAVAPMRPAPLPSGRYSLMELVEGQAAIFRGQGSAPFTLMADALAALAASIRATGATSVAEHEDRLAAMEAAHREAGEVRAYERGYEEARRELAGHAFA